MKTQRLKIKAFIIGLLIIFPFMLFGELDQTLCHKDFKIEVNPCCQEVCQGESASYTVKLTAVDGFDSPVNLTVSGVPTGASGTFTPSTVTPTGQGVLSVLNITTTASAKEGLYYIKIKGSGGGQYHYITVKLKINNDKCRDFKIDVIPGSQEVCQGESTSYNVKITGEYGFDSDVTLSVSGLPSGANGTFSPGTVTPDGQSVLTITTTASAAEGTYTFTVKGEGGGKTHSRQAKLIINTDCIKDFILEVTPGSQEVCQEESTSYTVNLTSVKGFDSPVNLSVTGLPSGANGTFNPGTVTPDGQSVLTITTTASAAEGTYNFTVKGEGGGKTHSQQVKLIIDNKKCGDFTIDITPNNQNVCQGESTSYTVNLTSVKGFDSPVNLSVSGLPAGATGTFSPGTVTPTGQSVLNITTTDSAAEGTYSLTVTGEGSGIKDSDEVTLIIEECDFEIKVPTSPLEVCQGKSDTVTVDIIKKGGFNADVSLSVSGLPAGAAGTFTPGTVVPTGESVLNITTTDSAAAGTYNITITGEGGGKTHPVAVTLIIKECFFEIEVTPSKREVCQGKSTSYQVKVSAFGNFNAEVTLSVSGLPQGAEATFTPGTVTPTAESVLDIITKASVKEGTYYITVTGTGGGKSHSQQVKLIIKNCDKDFDFEVTPDSKKVCLGKATSYNVKIIPFNGFNKDVNLSVSGLPAGVKGTFTPNPLTPNSQGELNITTTDSAQEGTYTIKITGKNGDMTHDAEVTLIIEECDQPGFDLEIKSEPGSGCPGTSAAYTVKVSAEEKFNSDVTLSVSGLPQGAAATFTPNPVSPGSESQLNITTSEETPAGSYTFTIHGEGGGKKQEVTTTLEVIDSRFSVEIKAEPEVGPAPLKVQFDAVITPEDFPVSELKYSWDLGDGSTSADKNTKHTYNTPGNYQVTLTVTGPCSSETASKEIEVQTYSGSITKSFSVKEAQAGDEVTITIKTSNNTNYDYKNVSIRDKLSPYLVYLEDDASVRPHRSGQELEWQFPYLKPGESIVIHVKVKVSEDAPPGTITNIAHLSYQDHTKPIDSNIATLNIIEIDIQVRKEVDKSVAKPGDIITYHVIVRNNSSVPLKEIEVTDDLSPYLELISRTDSFEFSRQGQSIQFRGQVEPNQEVVIIIKARIKADTPAGVTIENFVTVNAKEIKPIESNIVITTVTDEPVPPSQVRFTKRAEVPQTAVGRIIRFNITTVNLSNSTLLSPVIEDQLPQGFQYVANTTLLNNQRFADPQGGRLLVWQLPHIKPGETVVLRFQVIIGTDAARGRNINWAYLRAGDLFLEASAFVNVSGGFIFYCGVEGYVYLDTDCDEYYNGRDRSVEGIEVRLSTGEKAITNSKGYYSFEGLFPGEYAIGVNHTNLPEHYILLHPGPKLVVLTDGLTDRVDFALNYNGNGNTKPSLELQVFCPEVKAVKPGGLFRFEFIVRNTGKIDLHDVIVEDSLPAQFQYVPGSSVLESEPIADPQETTPGMPLEWEIGTLEAGASKTLAFTAVVDADVKPGRYLNEARSKNIITVCSETITSDIVECPIVARQTDASCCLKVEERSSSPFRKPEGPLSFIEPYFHTESSMFTVYAIFNLWQNQSLEKDGMPLFMRERLQNYARSTIEEFYLGSQLGLTLPDGSTWLSFAGAYPEQDKQKENGWLRKNPDKTMTVSQIGFELLALNEAIKVEKRVKTRKKLETIIQKKLAFLNEYTNNMEKLPHGWEIKEEEPGLKAEKLETPATLYDKVVLYLAMVELNNSGYNHVARYGKKLRGTMKSIDNKAFDPNKPREEFIFIMSLLEAGQKDQAAAKIREFENILAASRSQAGQTPDMELENLHDYALAAAVDYRAGGSLYKELAKQMKEKYYLQDIGIFADKQPDFTFKLNLANMASLILFFDTKDPDRRESYATILYRTFDEVGLFLKKRNLMVGRPLYSLLKNYPFAEPLLPILSFTKAKRNIAPVFSRDALVHSPRVKPLGEVLIPGTFSKILSPVYETSVSRIAALSFGLQYFGQKLMENKEWVVKEEGRSFDATGRKYIDSLLQSGAGLQKDEQLLLPFDNIAIKGTKKDQHNMEPLNAGTGTQFSSETLANYMMAEKFYVRGTGKHAKAVNQLMAFQARIVEKFIEAGYIPEKFNIFIENSSKKITVIPSKKPAAKITTAKLFHVFYRDKNHDFFESILKKTESNLMPEDLIFLSAAPELVPYFEKEIRTIVGHKDSKITENAADIIGRRLLGQAEGLEKSLDNLLKNWDKDAVLPKSDNITTIERGIIYHHEPQQFLLYLLATHDSMGFRFKRTLNFVTYLLENEWGLEGNSIVQLPSARYQVFKEEHDNVEPGDLINFKVRVDNTCPDGLSSAWDLSSLLLKSLFTPTLIYTGTEPVEGLTVLKDFQWRYEGFPGGSVLDYTYQAFVPYEYKYNFIEGTLYGKGSRGYQDFGPGSGIGADCEDTDHTGQLNFIPLTPLNGLVFEDRNANGIKDTNEPGIPNILLKDTRGRVFRSDAQGRFIVLAGDEHEGIQVELKSIPPDYILKSEPTRLVNRYYTGDIYFPIIPCETVRGFVYNDRNKNGSYDEGETKPEGILLKAKDKEVITGKDGEFIFKNIPLLWQEWIKINEKQPYNQDTLKNLKLQFLDQ